MQAIITTYHPATNCRGSRIKAECERGKLFLSYPHELSGDAVHRASVDALTDRFADEDLKKYGMPIDGNPWKLPYVTGGIPGGQCVHVFLSQPAMDQASA